MRTIYLERVRGEPLQILTSLCQFNPSNPNAPRLTECEKFLCKVYLTNSIFKNGNCINCMAVSYQVFSVNLPHFRLYKSLIFVGLPGSLPTPLGESTALLQANCFYTYCTGMSLLHYFEIINAWLRILSLSFHCSELHTKCGHYRACGF